MRSSSVYYTSFYRPDVLEKGARIIVSLILMLSMLFPGVFQLIKAVLLMFAFVLIFSNAVFTNKFSLAWRLYFLSCLYATFGMIWSLYGEILGNPGALRVLTVMVIYPILVPFLASLYRQEDCANLIKFFLLCAGILAIGDLVYVMAGAIFPGNFLQTLFEYLYQNLAVVDNSETYIKFTLPNVSSVIFILPFCISMLFFSNSSKGKIYVFFIVILLLVVAMLSGRRALLLSILLGPIISYIITSNGVRIKMKRKGARQFIVFFGLIFALTTLIYFMVEFIGVEYYLNLINSIFDFSSNPSNLERVYQFDALMRGIVDAPFIGKGAGAAADYSRSDDMPWAYELFFLSIIFQYGAIGFLLYSAGVVLICWHLILSVKQKSRSSFEFYFLSGFIAFMLATFSNPYLATFDYIWVLFIPYAIINSRLISNNMTEQ